MALSSLPAAAAGSRGHVRGRLGGAPAHWGRRGATSGARPHPHPDLRRWGRRAPGERSGRTLTEPPAHTGGAACPSHGSAAATLLRLLPRLSRPRACRDRSSARSAQGPSRLLRASPRLSPPRPPSAPSAPPFRAGPDAAAARVTLRGPDGGPRAAREPSAGGRPGRRKALLRHGRRRSRARARGSGRPRAGEWAVPHASHPTPWPPWTSVSPLGRQARRRVGDPRGVWGAPRGRGTAGPSPSARYLKGFCSTHRGGRTSPEGPLKDRARPSPSPFPGRGPTSTGRRRPLGVSPSRGLALGPLEPRKAWGVGGVRLE